MSPEEFELKVLKLLQGLGSLERLELEHRKILKAPDGDYEIDIVARFEVFGLKFLVLVECKHHKDRIKRETVQILRDRVQSLGAHKGVLCATSGFQKGAIDYARRHGIALIQYDTEVVVVHGISGGGHHHTVSAVLASARKSPRIDFESKYFDDEYLSDEPEVFRPEILLKSLQLNPWRNLKKAIQIHERVYDNRLKTFGRDHPDTKQSAVNLVKLSTTLGVNSWHLGNVSEAAELFRKAISVNPAKYSAAVSLSACLAKLGHVADAIAICEEVVKKHPRYSRAYYQLGNFSVLVGDFKSAAQYFKDSIELNQDDIDAMKAFADLLLQQGFVVEANDWTARAQDQCRDIEERSGKDWETLKRMAGII